MNDNLKLGKKKDTSAKLNEVIIGGSGVGRGFRFVSVEAVKENGEWCCPHCIAPLEEHEKIETTNDVQKYRCDFCQGGCFVKNS